MFTHRASFQAAHSNFPPFTEGSAVYSRNGEKLGKVVDLGDEFFTIEKGLFFPKEFTLRYDDISDVRDDAIYVNLTSDELNEWKDESYQGWSNVDDVNTGKLNVRPRDEFKDRYSDWNSNEDVRVPIVEEELEARKTARQEGEVKLHKVVHTELKHFTVPVTREDVKIERTPVTDRNAKTPTEGAFEEKEIKIPIMEEEISVQKRPVVKEEVRVSKQRTTEERTVEGEVKREDVEVEGEDALKKRKAG